MTEMSVAGFEQLWHTLKSLNSYTDVQVSKHGQEGPKRVLIFHLLVILRYGGCKQDVKATAELQIYWWSIDDIPPTHKELLEDWGLLKSIN